MTTSFEQAVVPTMPTRQETAELLGLSMKEVIRLDDRGMIARVPTFRRPVRYYGWSVRDFAEGKAHTANRR